MSEQASGIPQVTDKTLPDLVQSDLAALILTKSDCGHCASYSAEIVEMQSGGELDGVSVGKLVLDAPGAGKFKLKNPWIAKLQSLPYTLLFSRGKVLEHFAASKASYLEERLQVRRAEVAAS